MLVLVHVLVYVFIAICLVGVSSLLWVIFFSLRLMSQFLNSSDRFSRRTLWNPMNAIVNPGVLSQEGLLSRRRLLCGGVIFLLSFFLAWCVAMIIAVILR
jgi:hypothetical protein